MNTKGTPNTDTDKTKDEDMTRKRGREDFSSLSELDTSTKNETPTKNVKSKKKKKKCASNGTGSELNDIDNKDNDDKDDDISITECFRKLEEKITASETNLQKKIKEMIAEMKTEILQSVEHKINVMENRLFESEKENDEMKKEIGLLNKTLNAQIDENQRLKREIDREKQQTQLKLNDMEQYGRRNNIRIDGIENKDGEIADETTKVVIQKLNTKMKNLNITEKDIDACHRIGETKSGKRQIIVKFVSRQTRDRVIRSRKLFRDDSIYLNEDLTKLTETVLMSVKRKMTDEVHAVWSRDCKIYYKNKFGTVHQVKQNDYQTWLDLPWPAKRDDK